MVLGGHLGDIAQDIVYAHSLIQEYHKNGHGNATKRLFRCKKKSESHMENELCEKRLLNF